MVSSYGYWSEKRSVENKFAGLAFQGAFDWLHYGIKINGIKSWNHLIFGTHYTAVSINLLEINIKKHVALKSQRRDFFLFFFFKYSFSRIMSIDGTLSSKSARITINWRIKRCLSVASPQTSFGVPLSRIHFSPVEVGGGGNECVTNEPQRTSAGRLAYLTYQKFLVVPNEVKDGIEMVMKSLAQNVYIQCNPWLELWPSVQNCRDVSFKSKNHRLIFLCVKVVWIWITSYLS